MTDHPLKERLLAVMDQKTHWASASHATLSEEQLQTLERYEDAVYLRYLPLLRSLAVAKIPHEIHLPVSRADGSPDSSRVHAKTDPPVIPGPLSEEDLHPAAASYHRWLRSVVETSPWQATMALLTVFLEERDPTDGWDLILDHVSSEAEASHVLRLCMEALARWHRYRDGVAERMGITLDQAA